MNILVYYHKGVELTRRFVTTILNKISLNLGGVIVGDNFHTNGLLYVRNGVGGGYIYRQ